MKRRNFSEVARAVALLPSLALDSRYSTRLYVRVSCCTCSPCARRVPAAVTHAAPRRGGHPSAGGCLGCHGCAVVGADPTGLPRLRGVKVEAERAASPCREIPRCGRDYLRPLATPWRPGRRCCRLADPERLMTLCCSLFTTHISYENGKGEMFTSPGPGP